MLVTRSYPALCDPVDSGPPGSSVRGILQARILEWVAMPFSDLPDPGIELESPTLQILYRLSHQGSPEFVSSCPKLKMKVLFPRWRSGKESTSPVQEMQEIWVWSLSREDPLEKKMASHSNILPWKIPWTEKPGRLKSIGSQRVGYDWVTKHIFSPHSCQQ